MRTCFNCKRTIKDTESCWRDHLSRHFCDECESLSRGKHDKIPTPLEE